jgi:hypothetical protein
MRVCISVCACACMPVRQMTLHGRENVFHSSRSNYLGFVPDIPDSHIDQGAAGQSLKQNELYTVGQFISWPIGQINICAPESGCSYDGSAWLPIFRSIITASEVVFIKNRCT